ncbi:MAG: ABC transporter permease subunit [Thermoflexales bacterium]|nr:ABC transporter permease subunit [Thermoflexales bacterium]MDW8352617.1 ABC transporter permease subunit [Anaerolineae bacterium]
MTAPTRLVQSQGMSLNKRLERWLGRDWKIAALFVAPMVILMAGLILYPFLNAVYMSMFIRTINRQEVFVGLDNYRRLLTDAQFVGSIGNTIRFTVISVAAKLVVGLIIASLLNSRLPWRNVLSGIMLLPWIVPEVVTALTWRGIFDPLFGTLNPLLRALGIINRDIGWLSEPGLALASVIAVNIWKGIPFFTMLLLAGLKAIDKELYEASEVDGANSVQRFFNITLPGLRYVMAVTVLLSTISTFNTFGLIYLMTGGGPGGETRVYSILAYERALLQNRFGPGAAVSLMTAPFLAIFIILLARFMRQGVDRSAPREIGSLWLRAAGRALPWAIAGAAIVVAAVTTLSTAGLIGLLICGLITAIICAVLFGFGRFAAFLSTRSMPWLILAGVTPLIILAALSSGNPVEGMISVLATLAVAAMIGLVGYGLGLLAERHLSSAVRARLGVVFRLILLLPFLFFVLFPFYFVIITAFKSDLQIQQRVSLFWPDPWVWTQFDTLLNRTNYVLWFRNTVVIALITTAFSVFFAALGGYALARLKFRSAGALTTLLLVTYLLPGSLMFIPMYRILTSLGAINTHVALILTYPTFLMPFAAWVMMGYYRSIPEDLEEAAMIDGANRFGAFWRITLPLALPALLAITLIAFTNAWNEFLYAFVFLTSERLITLPVGLQKLVFADLYPYGQLMAASLIMSIPVVGFYIFAQRFLVEGLTAGSVKG